MKLLVVLALLAVVGAWTTPPPAILKKCGKVLRGMERGLNRGETIINFYIFLFSYFQFKTTFFK